MARGKCIVRLSKLLYSYVLGALIIREEEAMHELCMEQYDMDATRKCGI